MPRMMVETLLSLLLLLPLTACGGAKLPPPGRPIEGKILEAGSNKPIPGAIVIVRWQGSYSQIVDTQTVCYHVETVTTDEQGRYRTPAWKPTDLGPHFTSGPYLIDAYKAGYERDWPLGFDRSEEFKQNIYYLKAFKGTREERVEHLRRLSEATECPDAGTSKKNSLSFEEAIYNEARATAVTDRDKKTVEILLFGIESEKFGSMEALKRMDERKKGPRQ